MTNDFVICGDVTEIILPRRNGERVVTLIDTDDVVLTDSFPGTWYMLPRSNVRFYAIRSEWSNDRGNYNRTRLHRLVTNAPDGFDVDHRNHDGLDNRKANLRVVTRSRN